MSQVEMVLNMLRPVVASMSAADKSELLAKVSQLLDANDSKPATSGQNQSNSLSGINFSGGGNNALNFAPVQNQGGNVAVTSNFNQSYVSSPEVKQALEDLSQLKESIANSAEVNPLLKEPASAEVTKLAEELQKPTPNPSFIEKTILNLKQGLEGVSSLQEPTMKVVSFVAKLYGIPIP
ncbi:hypothetical protein H6F42_19850 [Pseudanabaena sp. FACHB-1998]|uniref:hypothetical protein n=1 Tax=Pseudanabaena sp. FACHB-1998 TaxID=2692858 RepID=UPI0016817C23|nr:hypothetical protein [Pseudanabaena sp. FACHB-1998]MBD2179180.1 hypothetical protein [Pseudanabaena sp. FACHB-1998]